MKAEEIRFTRRDVRAVLCWGDTQLKVHLARLLEMEYLVLHRRGLTYEYGLLWDGEDDGGAHLCGLLNEGDVNRSGGGRTVKKRPQTRQGKAWRQNRSGQTKIQ